METKGMNVESRVKALSDLLTDYLKSGNKAEEEILNPTKELLDILDNGYYNEGKAEVSDESYDELKRVYLSLTGQKEYDYVPGNAISDETYKHIEKILSLDKVNDKDQLRKELERLVPFIIEPKYDGLTVVVYPNANTSDNSYLAVTRGNGEEGDIITDSIKALGILNDNYIRLLKYPIRFEAYMKKSMLSKLNEERVANGEEPFKNTRNAAAGILRNKDMNEIKGIDLVSYNLVGANNLMSESEQLNMLHRHGIPVPDPNVCFKCNSISDIPKALEFIENFDRDSLDYDIDGLVIKANYAGSLDNLGGNTSHHPKNAIAWKFKAQGVWTTLNDVVWQTGRTGKISPVAVMKPVNLLGAEVSKATLHNIAYINNLGLKIGKEVYLIKANDVIPAITQCKDSENINSYKDIELPLKCPECNGQVKLEGDQLYCTNNDCIAKLINKIVHYASRDALNIEGLAESTAEKMIESGMIKYPIDIFKLNAEQIASLDGFAKKSGTKLFNAIQKARTGVNLEKFIYASGIPGVGRGTSKDLANHYKSFANMVIDIKSGCPQMYNIPDVGSITVDSIRSNANMLGMLFTAITPVDMPADKWEIKPSSSSSYSICITGTLSRPRSAISNFITSSGHTFVDRVNNSTDYLVVGDKVGQTKIDAAKKKGVKVISEQELYDLIQG